MSTTLTNGIIIPDNGSRNWGGDLANNWNILDVNVGYMTDVKNRVTTLETSVAENTANIQINTSNISALQTSKQDSLSDQQIANIADVTNKANDSDVVHKSGNETISGVKSFSSNGCTFFKQIKINHNLEYGKDNPPSQAAYHNLMFTAATSWWGSYIENVTDNIGNSTLAFYVRNTNEINSRVYLRCGIDGSFSMYPFSNNAWDLGTSTDKWKTLNGINPGALSLPNHNLYLDLKGNLPASVSDNLWTSRYQITPEQDGILILIFNDCAAAVVWSDTNLPSYGDRGTSICTEKRVMAFVLKGVPYNIFTNNYSQVASARLFYCQGNV